MSLSFRWLNRIAEVSQEQWDALAVPMATPFLEWFWLNGFERNDCVGGQTGWQPNHLTVWKDGKLAGAAALYLKDHSRGEFVFDQEWAEVSHQLGVAYYPKLLGMSPFTPVTGYRFLTDPQEDAASLYKAMLAEIDRFCTDREIAGCHFLHVDASWQQAMCALGMSEWLHHGLVWENQGFNCFDDYLRIFKSRKRNNIKRERRIIREKELRFRIVPGSEATPDYFELMYLFYAVTCQKFWGWSHYLTREFFQGLAEDYTSRTIFVTAFEPGDETPVAMSFLLTKGDQLYGRYWGCRAHYENLHFECCYYQPIEWAIANGIKAFDAGSGRADHKRRRGFPAQTKYSLHRFYNPVLEQLWENNIARVNALEQRQIDAINQK